MWLESTYQHADRLLLNILNLSLLDIAWLVPGVLAFALITVLLKKSVGLIANCQRAVYRTSLPVSLKKQLDSLLKIIKPNTAWLLALLIYQLSESVLPLHNTGVHIFQELLLLYVMYRLILLTTVFSLNSVYMLDDKYTPEPVLKKIYHNSVLLARRFSILFLAVRYLNHYLDGDGLLLASVLLIVFTTLHSYRKLLLEHQPVALRFMLRQLPSACEPWLKNRYEQHPADGRFVLAFLLAHFIRLVLSVHNRLLTFDYYKMLSARLLRLHLEQKLQAEPEEESSSDSRYERWFSTAYVPIALVDSDSVKQARQQFEDILEKWLADKALENDLLLTGAYGSGKTTAVKSWIEEAELDVDFHYIAVPAKTLDADGFFALFAQVSDQPLQNVEDFTLLDTQQRKTVIVLDDCHNLFLSDIHGFAAYKLLLECINAPLQNIFFVVLMSDEPCIYLNDVFGWSQQYSYHIMLKPWKVEDIRDLIMARHKASRRKLEFDELLFAGIGNDELSAYSATADRCYRLLWEQAAGIPALAMAIWAKAASRRERFTVEIGLPEKPSVNFLGDYPRDFLFIYSALARHQNLTLEEAACCTHMSENITRRALKLGRDAGFLFRDEQQRYRFQPLWAYPVISYLRAKNYLHGN